MSAEESLMPSSESGKLPQSYNIESGDAKFVKGNENVDMQTSTKLIGLTKEQLEKYRNDPFWRPVRYVLFVMFWAVWIAMFAGAIVIVVLSPKCDAKAHARWDQIAVHYQLFTPAFRDSNGNGIGDFNGVSEKMDLLRKLGVTSLWATPVIKTQKDSFNAENVIGLEQVDDRYGSEEDFVALINLAHKKEIKVVMDLPLSVSKEHKWNKDASFVDYVTKPSEGSKEEFVRINLKNPEARDAVIKSAVKFAKLGVDGFHVNDNVLSGYYNISALIKERLTATEELKQKEFIFFNTPSSSVAHSEADGLSYTIRSFSDLNGGLCNGETSSVSCVRTALKTASEAKPLPYIWKNGDINAERADKRFGAEHATKIQTLLTMIQMVLPGPVQTYYGEELSLASTNKDSELQNRGVMQWDPTAHAGFTSDTAAVLFDTTKDFETVNFDKLYEETRSPLRVYQKLAKLRGRTEVIQVGEINVKFEGDLVVISRYVSQSSDPVFLLVVNLPASGEGTTQKLEVNEALIPDRPIETAEVIISTPNNKEESHHRISMEAGLTLGPYEGILLKF
ncbi:hypothetical protein L596_004300 [Steinernema carpocapsae]|uniref:Glycosyl hydrolase family 13 catalytic domain-containing protein n=1 Tax=Steinernema carpocapsae TaxID=34508 RepID=A0A4U8UVH8_STECR|nr:hypothetical protein L596_004300 [Steinernema carpocapsae]